MTVKVHCFSGSAFLASYIYIYIATYSYIQGVAITYRGYTYFWPTFNGALVAEMSPNSVFWYLFFKIFLGGMPPVPLALACFACWVCFAHLHHQKGPLFLEKNLPTLSSVYGPANMHVLILSSLAT